MLLGTGPYPSLYDVHLHVGCAFYPEGEVKMSVQVARTQISGIGRIYLPWDSGDPVVYSIDGQEGPPAHLSGYRWTNRGDEETRTETWIAPYLVANDIITSLLDDSRRLVITVDPGEEHSKDFVFLTEGFRAAAKPALEYCDH